MARLFFIMGKSSTGKDSIYNELIKRMNSRIKRVIPYTTRPIRKGEKDGVDYFFCNEKRRDELKNNGKIIELRTYHTVHGDWDYFTVDDGQIDFNGCDMAIIGTPEAFGKIKNYYKDEEIVPIYIEVEDGIRLQRALDREKGQNPPRYKELCRRFLSDAEDFSEEKLKEMGITRAFYNENVDNTVDNIINYIEKGI